MASRLLTRNGCCLNELAILSLSILEKRRHASHGVIMMPNGARLSLTYALMCLLLVFAHSLNTS